MDTKIVKYCLDTLMVEFNNDRRMGYAKTLLAKLDYEIWSQISKEEAKEIINSIKNKLSSGTNRVNKIECRIF